MIPKQTEYKVGMYLRLSNEDERAGESLSIENQRKILSNYISEQGWTLYDEYVDDGISGTTFDRPGVQRMLDDAKNGRINLILCKDLSRFGRNYIQVGQYTDYIFPMYNIRFIALTDNVDTANSESTGMDMMPIMNVFNEWHAANTSKKLRDSWGDIAMLLPVQAGGWGSTKFEGYDFDKGLLTLGDYYDFSVVNDRGRSIRVQSPVFRVYVNDVPVAEQAARLDASGVYEDYYNYCVEGPWEPVSCKVGDEVLMAFACTDENGLTYEFTHARWKIAETGPEQTYREDDDYPRLTWPS